MSQNVPKIFEKFVVVALTQRFWKNNTFTSSQFEFRDCLSANDPVQQVSNFVIKRERARLQRQRLSNKNLNTRDRHALNYCGIFDKKITLGGSCKQTVHVSP